MKIVCRQSDNVMKLSSKEAIEGRQSVGSKRDTRNRRAEVLRALGKSTTESDITEGCSQFHSLICDCCYYLHICIHSYLATVHSSFTKFVFYH